MSQALTDQGPLAAYLALFSLLALAWAGAPTAGQAALVAAGVLAADGKLDIFWVLSTGTAGSLVGGIAGYCLGRSGGRAAWSAPGPFFRRRQRVLASGEKLFARYGALAVLVAPMWLAGIARMPWRSFLFWNGLAAAAWTVAGGLGGYVIGPAVTPLLGRGAAAVVAGVGVVGAGALLCRRLTRRRSEPTPDPQTRGRCG